MMGQLEATMRYVAAKGYLQACKMIFQSRHYPVQQVAVVLPLHMLAAFALELYLKAWLLKAGCPSTKVRAYGHDLDELYAQAEIMGLPSAKFESLKNHFAKSHSDYTYRYMDSGDSITNTKWPVAFKAFDDLDYAVDNFIGASASRGLQPGH